jgi:hypothetical protein
MGTRRDRALTFIAWSRVWSPLVSSAWRIEAWKALRLAGSLAELEGMYWQTFHIGMPEPRVPLQLHAALGCDGGKAREDWMRVFHFLGLRWQEPTLPPDHLGPACEALAIAVENDDTILAGELCGRYLKPWCAIAQERLGRDTTVLRQLPVSFLADLDSLCLSSGAQE